MKTTLDCVFISIMGLLLIASGLLSFRPTDPRRATASAKTVIATLQVTLDSLQEDTGRYPTTAEGLRTLMKEPASGMDRWQGPYLRKFPEADPWGREYHYVSPGQHNTDGYDLWSFGPDRKDGTKDDITNWPEK